jgi:hypothetical protein
MSEAERREKLTTVRRDEAIPFRVTLEKKADGDGGWFKAETIAGRNLWIWTIRHLLTNTIHVLEQHRWTILAPPDDVAWFTSDDPVVKLNFNSLQDYGFGGGWGNVGTDLLLPLGPHHLLYTQVGRPVPPRGSQMDPEQAYLVRRFIAEHAHRHIFAATPDPFVLKVRPRAVDAAELEREAEQWRRWHSEQSEAERDLIGWTSSES